MLALKMDPAAPLITHVIWAPGVYMVPRRDGRLIVGATVEEKAFDTSLTAGGLLTLLEAAWRTVPAIEELADRRDVGRASPGQPRRRADPRSRSGARA